MNKKILVSVEPNLEFLVQFTDKYILTKKLCLSVPRGYVAIVYIDGRAMYKSENCVNDVVFKKCGKEFLNKEVQFAFYPKEAHPDICFGFGSINVNNERLKEAYRVGVNGQMTLSIVDYVQLIKSFSFTNNITVESVRELILPTISSVGRTIVGECFRDSTVSIFEIDSMIGEIRKKMVDELVTEKLLSNIGIEIDSVAINEVFVNEEDLEMIRNRING